MKSLLVMLGLLVAWVFPAHAAWIQYDTTTMEVLGTFDRREDSRPKAGTELMQVQGTEPASAIVWPVPPTCTTGQREWTRVRLPSSLVVDPVLTFYRCTVVENWEQVVSLRNQFIREINDKYGDLPDADQTDKRANRLCPAKDTSEKCKNLHAQKNKLQRPDKDLDESDPDIDQYLADLTEKAALRKEAAALKKRMDW
jgi:hypothetical protein